MVRLSRSIFSFFLSTTRSSSNTASHSKSDVTMQLNQPLAFVLAALVAHINAAPAPCDDTPTPISEPTHMAPPTYVPPTPTPRPHHSRPTHHTGTIVITDTVTDTVTVSRTTTLTPTRTHTHVWSSNTPVWTSSTPQWPPSTTPTSSGGSSGQCNTGPIHCCDSVQDASSPEASNALQGLGLGIPIAAGVPIGLNCSPLSVLGLGTAGNW